MRVTKKALLEGLSYAIDIAEGSYISHSKHVAYISLVLAKELQLNNVEDLYYAALIHDIGAGNHYGVMEHSNSGAEIAGTLPLSENIADYIKYHHEEFDGNGPFGLKGDQIPFASQVILASNYVDYFLKLEEKSTYDVKEKLKKWLGNFIKSLNPIITQGLLNIIEKPFFLLEYYENSIDVVLGNYTKDFAYIQLEKLEIIQFAKVFASIIDNRNHFTLNHSQGIAEKVVKVVKAFGYDDELVNQMYIAALLHDIGKLAVSNDILDKPGSLEKKERFEIETHTYYTRWILNKIPGFENITEWAANHHEKLNGTGYPYGLKENDLDEFSRIMAIIDIYQALIEERPYRKSLSQKKVWDILKKMQDNGELDSYLINQIQERKIL